MGALRKPAADPMTVENFLAWDSGDHSGRPWQLVDGVPLAMATTAHDAFSCVLDDAYRASGIAA